jgi:hypothetical protein
METFSAYYDFGIFRIKMWVEAVTASNNNSGNEPFTEVSNNSAKQNRRHRGKIN